MRRGGDDFDALDATWGQDTTLLDVARHKANHRLAFPMMSPFIYRNLGRICGVNSARVPGMGSSTKRDNVRPKFGRSWPCEARRYGSAATNHADGADVRPNPDFARVRSANFWAALPRRTSCPVFPFRLVGAQENPPSRAIPGLPVALATSKQRPINKGRQGLPLRCAGHAAWTSNTSPLPQRHPATPVAIACGWPTPRPHESDLSPLNRDASPQAETVYPP